MKKVAKVIKVVAFLIICSICLSTISVALQYEHEMEPDLAMKEFYNAEENSSQILVLGSSHTTMGFSPMECYKQTQITSFNLSTAKQPIELARYLLEEALKTQTPEVVIYDVASLFYKRKEVNTAKFRYLMDSMPLSLTKVKLACAYANYNKDLYPFSIGEALCPIYYYHDRWKDMNEEEFNVDKAIPYLRGQVVRINITEIDYDMEAFDAKLAKKIAKDPKSAPVISENNLYYLLKMKELCDENNIKLLLTSTPTNRWNTTKKELIEQVCEEYELDFLDMNLPDGELLNYSTDMADGNHVNASGARKTTKFLYDYIIENYGIKGSYNEGFEKSMKYYDAYYNNMIKYNIETDFNEYLTLLNENKEDLAIFICARGESFEGLQENDVNQLKALNCTIDFDETNSENSYIAVIDEGKLTYEEVSEDELTTKYTLDNGNVMKLRSNGDDEENKASMTMDDREYAINGDGLNIVIYDKESELVIDSVSFNTHSSEKKWYRTDERSLELFMFKSYRNWVAENY